MTSIFLLLALLKEKTLKNPVVFLSSLCILKGFMGLKKITF